MKIEVEEKDWRNVALAATEQIRSGMIQVEVNNLVRHHAMHHIKIFEAAKAKEKK